MSAWRGINKFDQRGLALYERHYSCRRYADGRVRRQFAPPGETLILLTETADALFGWVRNKVERYDHQTGVCCFVFRNEGELLSSQLIEEAMSLCQERWNGERMFTYVNAEKIASRNPGFCFKKAGWRLAGQSKSGLLLLEAQP